jgi:hypothetical protein
LQRVDGAADHVRLHRSALPLGLLGNVTWPLLARGIAPETRKPVKAMLKCSGNGLLPHRSDRHHKFLVPRTRSSHKLAEPPMRTLGSKAALQG